MVFYQELLALNSLIMVNFLNVQFQLMSLKTQSRFILLMMLEVKFLPP